MLSAIGWSQVFEFVLSSLVAVLCGLIIGLERESKGKPAGVRTLVLICIGASIYVHVSFLLAGTRGDPGRAAAQIVSGVGFLGAGAILQHSHHGYVAGLTTAASIWVTAALGMVIGTGHYVMAISGMLIVVMALRFLFMLETYLFYEGKFEIRKVMFESNYGKTKWALVGMLEENLIRPEEYVFHEDARGKPILELKFMAKNRNHRAFLAQISNMSEILEVV